MTLSILCVTKTEPHAWPFLAAMRVVADAVAGSELVVAADGDFAYHRLIAADYWGPRVQSQGYIESVLDEALTFCSGDYVLRLDDDERCSPAMVEWLKSGAYSARPTWKFPRMQLWGDEQHFIVTPQLWPDTQSRLALRSLSGGRNVIHAGSPHGGGTAAPCSILHAKFLVKSLAERREIVKRYDSIQPGAGTNFAAFSVPEDVLEEAGIAEVGDGSGREVVTTHVRLRERAA